MNLRDHSPRQQGYARPWQTREEMLVDQALDTNFAAEDALRQVPPPFVRDPFPARTGFRKMEPTIHDILNIDRYMPTHKSWTSGFPAQFQHGERVYTQGEQAGQASSRNDMGMMW